MHFYLFMTGSASNGGVFAFQFERRFIVVEFAGLPVFKYMAALAICDPVSFKLIVVYVFMTGGASRFHPGKFLIALWEFATVVFPVAGHAILCGVRAQ